ncbi:citrate transporter, partial [Pseudomonas aeruginosa]
RRPKLPRFNAILTVVLMATLLAGLLPMPVLFMIPFGIDMLVNYPCLQEQQPRIGSRPAIRVAIRTTVRIA